MKCIINSIQQHERHFWNCLYGVATQDQIVKNRVSQINGLP